MPNNKLEKLKELMKVANQDTVSFKQLGELVRWLNKFIKDTKADFAAQSKEDMANIQAALAYIDSENSKLNESVSNLSKESRDSFDGSVKEIKSLIKELKALVVKGEDGIDGKDADEDIIAKKIADSIVIPEPDSAEQLIEKLNSLEGAKLNADLIVLPESTLIEIDGIKNKLKHGMGGSTARNLYQLQDVDVSGVSDNDVLTYDSATGLWGAETAGGGVAWGAITGTLSDQSEVVTEADGIAGNDNDTTFPTNAAVIDYVADQVATSDTLQEVTDNGATTDNNMSIDKTTSGGEAIFSVTSGNGEDVSLELIADRGDQDGDSWRLTANNSSSTATEQLYFQSYASGSWNTVGTINSGGSMQYDGSLSVGTSDVDAKAQILDTGEQLRLAYDASNYASFTVDSGGNMAVTPTGGQFILPTGGSAADPTLEFGDASGDGLFASAAGTIKIVVGGTANFSYTSNELRAENSGGATMVNDTASASLPTLLPRNADKNTGIGWSAGDTLEIITGGTSAITVDSSQNVGIGTAPSARIHSLSTTEQLRLSYDGSNYAPFVVASNGDLQIDPTGGEVSINENLLDNGGKLNLYSGGDFNLNFYESTNLRGIIKSESSDNSFQIDSKNAYLSLNKNQVQDVTMVEGGGDVAIGHGSPSAKLHPLATTEQLRLGYDVSNYSSFTTDSSGNLQIDTTGGSTFNPGTFTVGTNTAPNDFYVLSTNTTDLAGSKLTRNDVTLTAGSRYQNLLISSNITENSPHADAQFAYLEMSGGYQGTGTLKKMYGAFYSPRNNSTGTVTTLVGTAVTLRNTSTGTISEMIAHDILSPVNSGTVTSSAKGIQIEDQGLSGVTNTYGIDIEDQTTSTNPYAIRTGAGIVSFGDDVTITGSVSATTGYVERVVTTTDDATAVIDVTATDVYELSAIANATTFSFTGTPVDGQKIVIRFKDAGVTKGLTWTGFTAIGVTLPTTTTVSKWHYVGVTYNSAASQWHATAVTEEA